MSLGVLLLWTSFPRHFSPVIVTLVSSGYPFVGAKCVSPVGTRGRVGPWEGGERGLSLVCSPVTWQCPLFGKQRCRCGICFGADGPEVGGGQGGWK